jgi:hypothetical protein
LVIAPILGGHSETKSHSKETKKEVKVEITQTSEEVETSKITSTKTIDGIVTKKKA